MKHYKDAYKYINSRIKNKDVISNFEIGYCPGDQEFISFLEKKGFSLEEIKKTDFLIKNNQDQFLEDLEID